MKMKNIKYLLILITCTLFSCKKKNEKVQQVTYNIYEDTIPRNKKRVKTLKLKPSIKNKIAESEIFTITSEYIDSLNIVSNSELNDIAYVLNEQLEELPRELDSTIKNKGVLSRIKQIETYSRAIIFEASKNNRDTIKINEHVIKTLESYNNFISQLNETDTKLNKDFKKQLEKNTEIRKDTIEGVPLF